MIEETKKRATRRDKMLVVLRHLAVIRAPGVYLALILIFHRVLYFVAQHVFWSGKNSSRWLQPFNF